MKIRRLAPVILWIFTLSACTLILPGETISFKEFEDGLPVINIFPVPGSRENYRDVTVVYRGKTYNAKGKQHGRTSLVYPKKSYTLKFDESDPFIENIPGFNGVKKVILITTFDDNSRIRQKLAYDIWNSIDNRHIKVNSFFVVVYAGLEYLGLYTAVNCVDGDLMEHHGLWEHGNLYKAVEEVNFGSTLDLAIDFEKKEGLDPSDMSDLADLITFIASSDDDTYKKELYRRINIYDYADWYIFVNAIAASDSAGKNSYHYHNPNDPLWRYIPWDFNNSFGQRWNTRRQESDSSLVSNLIFKRMKEDPGLRAFLLGRFSEKLNDVLSSASLQDRIDVLYEQVAKAAKKDERLWDSAYRSFYRWADRTDFTDFKGEIAYIRQWITERIQYLEELIEDD